VSDGVVAQPDAATWSSHTARQEIARIVRAMARAASAGVHAHGFVDAVARS
jgi:hypothetical protein